MRVRAQRAVQPYAFRHRPPVIPVGEDRVFLTRDGRRMTRNTVHRFVKRLGRQAGVEREHPHLFRHSTRVAFLRGGGSESVLQRILGHDRLDDLLRDSDVVVNAAPLTPATVRLFGRQQFAHMRPTACFINVGRGETVDQDALRDGVIAAAGLDVTTPESLPPESPLWALPNVILTAHYAGWSDTMLDRIYAIFADNLRRFDRGEPLRNQVDVRAGY